MTRGELALAISEAVDPTSLIQRICDHTLALILSAEGVAIGLLDGSSITYVCGAGRGPSPVGTVVSADGSLSGLAISTGQVLRSADTSDDPRVDADACRRLSVASLVCVPLMHSQQHCGVMAVNAPVTHAFDDSDVAMLTRLADFVAVAVASACDIHRAGNDLLELTTSSRVDLDGDLEDSIDDTTGRYMMNVLHPASAARMENKERIERLMHDPDAMHIVFQPIVDLTSGVVIAVEALSRFTVPPPKPPNDWFDAAHTVGLGIELEAQAIARALSFRSKLPPDVRLSVNVGPQTLVDPSVIALMEEFAGELVVIELTEHTAFDRYPSLAGTLAQLRQDGVELSVDDAGSGYSSLTHILKLAPDFIKLDRELISGIDLDPIRRALVTSLVTFAAETGAQIVAEGVERSDEVATLRSLGVQYAQGFFLARPAPLDTLRVERPIDLTVSAERGEI